MSGFWSAIKDIWRLAYPYFVSKEQGSFTMWRFGTYQARESYIALFLLAFIITVEVLSSFISKWLNAWNNLVHCSAVMPSPVSRTEKCRRTMP